MVAFNNFVKESLDPGFSLGLNCFVEQLDCLMNGPGLRNKHEHTLRNYSMLSLL